MNQVNLCPLMVIGFLAFLLISCESDILHDSAEDPFVIKVEKRRVCMSVEHTQKLMQNPDYAKERNARLSAFDKISEKSQLKVQCNNPVQVPVAIHFQSVGSTDLTCLTAISERQIAILNHDYAGTNADISKWTTEASSYYSGVNFGEACIQFVIADQNHPTGFGLSNGQKAITVNQTQGDQVNAWAGYLNIYVQSGTGVLGYAPLGGAGNGDGVVIEASAFGSGQGCGGVTPEAPFNLGRTLTHEIGHYFLLDHIWGNGCGVDDGVADTPDQQADSYGCPALGTSSCGSNDLHMNYMDYTNDACMYMFSAGQASRMENYLSASLGNLTSNVSNVYSGSSGSNNGGDTGGDTGTNNICEAPTSATSSEISTTEVLIDWEDIFEANRYRIRYRIIGSGQWTRRTSNISQRSITNLVSGESYEYQIRSRCPTGWTSWSSKFDFDLSADSGDDGGNDGDDANSNSYTLIITLDDYGSETTWGLYTQQNVLLNSGGPYQDFQAGSQIEIPLALADGCYELDLYDTWGDGICCDYGNGKAELINAAGQVIAQSDGQFGSYELIEFCVSGSSSRITRQERDAKKVSRGSKRKR